MTAEVAIMNRSGIALAADSALTIGKDRVWKNSNKLFQLTPASDVAVLFFGSGEHCGIPWEIVLKEFRKDFGTTTLPAVADYVEKFTAYLDAIDLPRTMLSDASGLHSILNVIEDLKPCFGSGSTMACRKSMLNKVDSLISEIESDPILLDDFSIGAYSSLYKDRVKQFMEEELKGVFVTKKMVDAAIKVCYERARRSTESSFGTGLVFAGYGSKQWLPAVIEMRVDGAINGTTRVWQVRESDMNTGGVSSTIMPFAQADIANLFVEGTLPQYVDYVDETLLKVLDRKAAELISAYVPAEEQLVELERQKRNNRAMSTQFSSSFGKFRGEESIKPLMKVVNSLPKEEMALMAEALVEITSLRRKMDSRLETVGGPVDVAIVSKADGFVWIKRKHYFDLALNPDFVQRKLARIGGV